MKKQQPIILLHKGKRVPPDLVKLVKISDYNWELFKARQRNITKDAPEST